MLVQQVCRQIQVFFGTGFMVADIRQDEMVAGVGDRVKILDRTPASWSTQAQTILPSTQSSPAAFLGLTALITWCSQQLTYFQSKRFLICKISKDVAKDKIALTKFTINSLRSVNPENIFSCLISKWLYT